MSDIGVTVIVLLPTIIIASLYAGRILERHSQDFTVTGWLMGDKLYFEFNNERVVAGEYVTEDKGNQIRFKDLDEIKRERNQDG